MDLLNGSDRQTSWTDQLYIFEALASLQIQRLTFQFVHCRSFRVRQRPCCCSDRGKNSTLNPNNLSWVGSASWIGVWLWRWPNLFCCIKVWIKNKAFVGLRSCDNVQTERSIFEYANWQRLQVKRTGLSSWFVQLVRPADPFSWSVQLVRSAGPSRWYVQLVCLADRRLKNLFKPI